MNPCLPLGEEDETPWVLREDPGKNPSIEPLSTSTEAYTSEPEDPKHLL